MEFSRDLLSEYVFGSLSLDSLIRAFTIRSICSVTPLTASHRQDQRVTLSQHQMNAFHVIITEHGVKISECISQQSTSDIVSCNARLSKYP
jgi:hypothetical protein